MKKLDKVIPITYVVLYGIFFVSFYLHYLYFISSYCQFSSYITFECQTTSFFLYGIVIFNIPAMFVVDLLNISMYGLSRLEIMILFLIFHILLLIIIGKIADKFISLIKNK